MLAVCALIPHLAVIFQSVWGSRAAAGVSTVAFAAVRPRRMARAGGGGRRGAGPAGSLTPTVARGGCAAAVLGTSARAGSRGVTVRAHGPTGHSVVHSRRTDTEGSERSDRRVLRVGGATGENEPRHDCRSPTTDCSRQKQQRAAMGDVMCKRSQTDTKGKSVYIFL